MSKSTELRFVWGKYAQCARSHAPNLIPPPLLPPGTVHQHYPPAGLDSLPSVGTKEEAHITVPWRSVSQDAGSKDEHTRMKSILAKASVARKCWVFISQKKCASLFISSWSTGISSYLRVQNPMMCWCGKLSLNPHKHTPFPSVRHLRKRSGWTHPL